MELTSFIRSMTYALSFVVCAIVLSDVDFSKILYPSKSRFAILLYFICSIALAYLLGSFVLVFTQ